MCTLCFVSLWLFLISNQEDPAGVSRWCLRLWGLIRTVLQFEDVHSFIFHYTKWEAVPVRNFGRKNWVSEWLTVSPNMSKFKAMISPCSTVSGSQIAASLNTCNFVYNFIKKKSLFISTGIYIYQLQNVLLFFALGLDFFQI